MKTNFGRLAKIFQIYSMDADNYKLKMTYPSWSKTWKQFVVGVIGKHDYRKLMFVGKL